MKIFIAGIMQGSHVEAVLHQQDYRKHLRETLREAFPGAEIYDPLEHHRSSLGYDDPTGRAVFMHHNRMCREVDVLLAFLPAASMGTAIEMWEAYQAGAVVIAITPMKKNWAVKFLSHEIYQGIDEFNAAVADGRLARRIAEVHGNPDGKKRAATPA